MSSVGQAELGWMRYAAPSEVGAMQTIAYLTSQYPAVSHTFIQREILALREAGVPVQTFSIRRPPSDHPRSEADEAELGNTFYLLPPRPLRLLRAHLALFGTRPGRYASALFHALAVRPAGLRALVWHLFYFVEAAYLWHEIRRRGIRHVHAHFAMACATVAMIASHFGDLTFSMTVHGPSVFCDSSRYLLQEKVRQAVMVMCISDFCRSQVMSLSRPVDWAKLKVVHCGIAPERYAPREPSTEEESRPMHLLNVARLSSVKAHAILLAAVAELKMNECDVRCTIVGDGPERSRLESLCEELGIQEDVTFTGLVDQDAIQRYYDEADIFVLPSFAEGVPVVLMEAMANGLPVVASRIMGIPELVQHGVHGFLVPPGRVRPLAEAIAMVGRDLHLCAEMGAKGREKVCREFDVRQAAKQLSEHFAEIQEGVPVPRRPASGGGAV